MQIPQDSFSVLKLKFFNLQHFTFEARKQPFDSSFSLWVTETLNEPI